MEKRTRNQIEKDFTAINKFVKANSSISSVKEIAVGVGLTESLVRTSLEKHPRIYDNIRKLIVENKKRKLAEKEALKAKREPEIVGDEVETPQPGNTQANGETGTAHPTQNRKNVKYVIDASITGIPNLHDTLNDICSKGSTFVLTSVTIKELDKMQKYNDIKGSDARKILGMAAENQEDFQCVKIDETVGSPDFCIIKYCADSKEKVVLLTADKTMVLTARTFGVKTSFLKQEKNPNVRANFTYNSTGAQANTLHAARRVSGKLFITCFSTPYRSSLVLSNGIEYNSGVQELKVGDDVYIATKKDGYLTFAHYIITSLEANNNCKLSFSKRIYDVRNIDDLPVASYKSFMRDFYHRGNL